MIVIVAIALVAVAVLGTAVVLTNDPARQAITLSILGLALAVLFATLMAPDVALSQVAVGSAVVPLMVMLAVRKNRERD
jgi:energy-converting hydrogenase B subunit D